MKAIPPNPNGPPPKGPPPNGELPAKNVENMSAASTSKERERENNYMYVLTPVTTLIPPF